MSKVCEWMRSNDLQGICGEILSFIPMPLMAGRVLEDDLIVEEVNDNLRSFLHDSIMDLPESAETLFSSISGPKDMSPLDEAARGKGWSRRRWQVVKGKCELELFCWGDGGDKFVAFFDDMTPHEVHTRLMTMKERILFLINLYDAKGMIPQLLSELVEHLGVDWAGLFVWDGARENWVLSGDEANPAEFRQESFRNAVTFSRRLSEARGGPFGHQFGGLPIQDGSLWWIPWAEDAGEWEMLMSEAGFGSLFAGVLLTGSSPAVLLCLSRESGCFARINRDVLESLWPIFLSLAERNRAVSGITKLYTRDPVTGLYAQNMMYRIMKQEMNRSRRYRYPLTLIMMKIANMNVIRSRGGIEAVDETVQRVSRHALKSLRNVDIGGRIGDDTLLLLLPHTPAEGANIVSGRLASNAPGLSPFPAVPLEVEIKSAVMDESCMGPEDLLAKLSLSWSADAMSGKG